MYPFESRLRWWIQGRPRHLIEAVSRDPALAAGAHREAIAEALLRIRKWLVARTALLVLLSMGIVSSILSVILRALPRMVEVEAGLSLFVRISTALAGVFTLLYLLANRTLGQLEIDILLLMQLTQTEHRHE